MKDNAYLIGAGTWVGFACLLIVTQTILKGGAAVAAASDSPLIAKFGMALGSIL